MISCYIMYYVMLIFFTCWVGGCAIGNVLSVWFVVRVMVTLGYSSLTEINWIALTVALWNYHISVYIARFPLL